MKKRLLATIIIAATCVAFTACGKNHGNEFGKDSKEVYATIDSYLDAYCKADVKKINSLCAPKDERCDVKLIPKDRFSQVDYPVVAFQKDVGICNPASFAASSDYMHMYNWEETKKYLIEYADTKVEAKYDIKEVKHSDEIDTLVYAEGLKRIDTPAREYVNKLTGLEVEDFYVVVADIDFYFNGKNCGNDEKEVKKVVSLMVDENEVQNFIDIFNKSVDRQDEDETTFVVYKYEGEWYVYSAYIIRDSYLHKVMLQK